MKNFFKYLWGLYTCGIMKNALYPFFKILFSENSDYFHFLTLKHYTINTLMRQSAYLFNFMNSHNCLKNWHNLNCQNILNFFYNYIYSIFCIKMETYVWEHPFYFIHKRTIVLWITHLPRIIILPQNSTFFNAKIFAFHALKL